MKAIVIGLGILLVGMGCIIVMWLAEPSNTQQAYALAKKKMLEQIVPPSEAKFADKPEYVLAPTGADPSYYIVGIVSALTPIGTRQQYEWRMYLYPRVKAPSLSKAGDWEYAGIEMHVK